MSKKPKEETALVVQNTSAEALISKAIEKGIDVATMERLLAMRTQIRAEESKEAFDADMAKLQGELETIKKTKEVKNDNGRVLYSYAPLESIVEQTKAPIGNNGFSYMVKTEMPGDKVKVICIVKHRLGHSEETTIEMPLATRTGIMSAPQQMASTLTFAKRYAFCNAFGIMTGDEDNDANDDETKVLPTRTYKPKAAPVVDDSLRKNEEMPADFGKKEEVKKPEPPTVLERNKKEIVRLLEKTWNGPLVSKSNYEMASIALTALELTEENYEKIILALTNRLEDSKLK